MRNVADKSLVSLVAAAAVWALAVAGALAQAEADSEVRALDQRIADAVVRGDTDYVARVTADDFVMVHGDGWTHGGQPLRTDDKQALLDRVATKYYDVLAFDSVQAELHGNVAITHGRYLAHTPGVTDANRAWFSVRYERVYAQRDGGWQYLSHRTVHGPIYGPSREAVVDDADQTSPPTASTTSVTVPSAAGGEVLELERAIGMAIARGHTQYFDEATADDFVMLHGDGWTKGGQAALVDDKASFMPRVASNAYAVHDYDRQAVELHDDVAITYGRYIGNIPSSPPDRRWFYVWYQKVYAQRDGRWVYLSHRTVDGAHYAVDRASLHLE
ncbi:MAG TPA: nuclear transport factor 2 family protein [Gammaproteobacteria bacterium]|nr:nuclear transport factor 2 family protein [Gammaproteobacteria bacterium]